MIEFEASSIHTGHHEAAIMKPYNAQNIELTICTHAVLCHYPVCIGIYHNQLVGSELEHHLLLALAWRGYTSLSSCT